MFWSSKPTIDADDVEWQLSAWGWLLDNLGGATALKTFASKYPTHADFPKSGLSGHEHVAFVFSQLCQLLKLDTGAFELRRQGEAIDAHVGHLAVVKNLPGQAAGTYRAANNRQIISYDPKIARDLGALIAVLAHELCHSVLHSIPTRSADWNSNEEFVTDLATVFFGFGIFGGNQSFQFSQFRDVGSGTQGWSTRRLGYLTQNEWGFALAIRALLTNEDVSPIRKHATAGLYASFQKNCRYLEKNHGKLAQLIADH